MPQASFVLKEPNCKEDTLVYLLYRFNGSKLKFSTSLKINPRFWNPDKQRAKETRQYPGYSDFNFLLDKLESCVTSAYRKVLLEGTTPTPELLRSKLNQLLKRGNSSSKDLVAFAESIIVGSDRKDSTKRAIGQTLRILKEFKGATRVSLHLDSIDLNFYDNFLGYLKRQEYSQNTIGSHIKNVKVFMREAVERGLTKNIQFQSKKFKKIQEDSDNVYLTEEEIKRLLTLDLSSNTRLEKVRDLFIVGCFTGLRFSDLTQIKIENINKEKRVIKLKTQKTEETLVIPINSVVGSIIDKYGGNLPIAISNVKMNAYLKEVAVLADLSEPIERTFTKGGQRIKQRYLKADLITVHTARRSFATNAFLKNVPSISIMKITGHRTEKSFMKYIKISQEDNANKLINHPFFQ